MPWAPITRPLPEQPRRSLVTKVLWVSTWPQLTTRATGGAETVQENVAGERSTRDSVSMARTASVCPPTPRPVNDAGDVQAVNAPASSLHSNVTPGSSDEKVNVADVATVVGSGPLSMIVSGSHARSRCLDRPGVHRR